VLNFTTFCRLCFITENTQHKKNCRWHCFTLSDEVRCVDSFALRLLLAEVHYFNKVNKNAQRLLMLLYVGAAFLFKVWHCLMKVIRIDGSVFCFAAVGRL